VDPGGGVGKKLETGIRGDEQVEAGSGETLGVHMVYCERPPWASYA